MPIRSNIHIGSHPNCTEIVFGTGDISMALSQREGENSAIVLSQGFPKPIEEWESDDSLVGKMTDELTGPLVELVFNRRESIDNFISLLKILKDRLTNPAEQAL